RVGLVAVVAIVLPALLAPVLPLKDPDVTRLDQRLLPPLSEGFLLGTDSLGRDLLSRLLWGTRVSLAVALLGTGLAAAAGTLIGLAAAWYRRLVDGLLMRGIDVLMAFPYLLLALSIVAVLGPGLRNATLAIALVNVPFFARTVRGAALSLREQEFLAAARLSGLSDARILATELLPNVLPLILVTLASTIGWMVLETAGLSFLGLGAQPPQADLGSMLGQGRVLLATASHVALLPGGVLFVLVVGLNLLGDGARDALDPRVSGTGAGTLAPTLSQREREPSHGHAVLSISELTTGFVSEGTFLPAVRKIDLLIRPGESVALVGESGSGKSLTALSLLGLIEPPGLVLEGSIRLLGEELRGAPPSRLQRIRGRHIGYVPQDPMTSLNPLYTIGEQLIESLTVHQPLRREEARSRAISLLESVRIPDASRRLEAWPHELSGGMRQRVAIALALAHEPELLIADEPTTGLDVTTQAQVLDLLRELCQRKGTALLFITHDFGVVSELCERVVVLYAGEVVEAASTEVLLHNPRHPYTRRLLACVPRLGEPERALEAIPGQPPRLEERPQGCAFAPRCAFAQPQCQRAPVELSEHGTSHHVRCLRAGEEEEAA
ncbi:MAG TPA: dipeptide/oligopeptide/nickel ABC transporter permease/ATP-binding protein, partial [Myxococcaceae bacterium]|nr:dipeptide/oligopeptide/nickel ABC transporter permease/ATP-binding protein [Myxococcaceae bacterium]